MTHMPPDAQRSDDGNWWWDGTQWQPVLQGEGESSSSQSAQPSVAGAPPDPSNLNAADEQSMAGRGGFALEEEHTATTEVLAMVDTGAADGEANA